MKRYKRYCIAAGCRNSNNCLPDLSFFSLPKDPERRKEWLILIGRDDLLNLDEIKYKSYQVCTAHFNKSAIEVKIIRKLKGDAMPIKVDCSKLKQTVSITGTKADTKPVQSIRKHTQTNAPTISRPQKRKLKKTEEINFKLKQKCKQNKMGEINPPKLKQESTFKDFEVVNVKQEIEDEEEEEDHRQSTETYILP